ncbi:hypothetical protein AB205_0190120 [Aquarana catesbeiana]|uniref:Uncharacterized protein n=1 Tax=Aquarana catesbeiana TaxID=8400 RepID=A0A2G9PQS4_AQUCT|nr:hypothetical protein AB205_0190120 [Aquarana catesbeiana]
MQAYIYYLKLWSQTLTCCESWNTYPFCASVTHGDTPSIPCSTCMGHPKRFVLVSHTRAPASRCDSC